MSSIPRKSVPDREADVIVVGAGPAGSTAATYLARAGIDVLLLEKASFPRDKVCGDGLTPRGVRQLTDLGIDTSEAAGWVHSKGLRIITGERALELDWPDLASYPSYGVSRTRRDFDDLLAKNAGLQDIDFRLRAGLLGGGARDRWFPLLAPMTGALLEQGATQDLDEVFALLRKADFLDIPQVIIAAWARRPLP